MSRAEEPLWILLPEILAVHEKLLAVFGGPPGIRDIALLESALDRPKNQWGYVDADYFSLAAAYADGIINNHPFVDGNKRTGFIAAALFLETNGYKFNASEAQVVTMTLGLADKSFSAIEYAQWLRDNSDK